MNGIRRLLLIAEVVICFGPIFLIWLAGLLLIPIQLIAVFVDFPDALGGVLFVFVSVSSGAAGFLALSSVLKRLFDPSARAIDPNTAMICIVVAVVAVVTYIVGAESLNWKLVGILPMVATLHIGYLGRNYLLGRDRDHAE
jgi:hypothetical protein